MLRLASFIAVVFLILVFIIISRNRSKFHITSNCQLDTTASIPTQTRITRNDAVPQTTPTRFLHVNRTTTTRKPLRHNTSLLTRDLACKPGLYLLILVTSHAWTGYERRSTIRQTWGQGKVQGAAINGKTWQVFFIMGSRLHETKSKLDAYRKMGETTSLRNELTAHRDIVQGDFVEEFYHLPLKLNMAFEWANLYCNFSYMLKTDDDTFIHKRRLIELLSTLNAQNIYTGAINSKMGVSRTGKYAVTMKEFSKKQYPPFASGATMIFSRDVIERMSRVMNDSKVFKLDDVYIGIVVDSLKIKATNVDPKDKHKYWDVWRYGEKPQECAWYPTFIIRAVHFWNEDKRWCIHKIYHES